MKSKNEKVTQFLIEVQEVSPEKYQILNALRKIIFDINTNTEERMMYGGIMFSSGEDFGGIFASKNHISFEFSQGYKMNDPQKLLEGAGKFRRHLKIKNIEDIEAKQVNFFVKQAIKK